MTLAALNVTPDTRYERLTELRLSYIEDIMLKCDFLSNAVIEKYSSDENRMLFQEICRVIHSMKGTAAMYDISMISAICHRFEDYLLGRDIVKDMNNDKIVDRILQYLDLISLSAVVEKHSIPA